MLASKSLAEFKFMKIEIKKQQLSATLGKQLTGLKKLEKAAGGPLQRAVIPGIIYLTIDTSGSMSGSLNEAKLGAIAFAKQAQQGGHAVGLISFDSSARHVSTPQRVITPLESAVKSLEIGGSTNLTEALTMAASKLCDSAAERVIYVVTDGMPDSPETALNVAEKAKRQGITIMTLGTDGADKNYLSQLASRKELAVKVDRPALQGGIASMARLLIDRS